MALKSVPLVDSSPPLSASEITEIQAICGALLYYCIAVDPTRYRAVTALASEQSHATVNTRLAANRLLAYFHKAYSKHVICGYINKLMVLTSLAPDPARLQAASLISATMTQLK